jgi:FkbM family methyltransferase
MIFSYQYLLNKYKISPKGIIHIGAHHAEESTVYARCSSERVLWIEGNPDLLPIIQDTISIYSENEVHQALLSDVDDQKIIFNITNASMSSSILELGTHKEQYPGIVIEKELVLFTNRFDAFAKMNNLEIEQYNFVNLDIQGAELLALKGFGNCLDKMDYIYTEINIEHVYENCPLLDEIDEFLYSKGFQRVELSLKYESWGDAFYIRKQKTEFEKQKSLSESKKIIQKFEKNKKTSNYNVKNSFFYKVVRKLDNKFFKKSKSEIVNQVTRPFNEDFEFKLLNQYKKENKIILFDIESNHGEYVEKIIKHLNVINLNYEFHLFESKINRFLCCNFASLC